MTGAKSNATHEATVLARAHPLTMFGFDALVAGAARLRPSRIAVRDVRSGDADIDHAELDRRIDAFRSHLRHFDLQPGERVVLACAPSAETLIAVTGVIAAGLEPVLAPLGLSPDALAAGARAASAAALIAPASVEGANLEEMLFGVAAQTPSIRLIGTLGPGTIDGAVDLSSSGLAAIEAPAGHERTLQSKKVTIGTLDRVGELRFVEQGALLAHGLGLVAKARVSGAAPLVSLVSPGSIAGLIAGPLASLLSGAPLHFISPFDATAFLAHLDAIGPARLVAPRGILPDLDAAGLLTDGALLSCIAISRPGDEDADFERRPSTCPIIEIASDGAPRVASAPQQDEAAA